MGYQKLGLPHSTILLWEVLRRTKIVEGFLSTSGSFNHRRFSISFNMNLADEFGTQEAKHHKDRSNQLTKSSAEFSCFFCFIIENKNAKV
jgi:hypothetical protein